MAELTYLPARAARKPTGPVETFSSAAGATETVQIDTDDAAMILIRYENGARGVMSTSRSIGRKNSLQWDVVGFRCQRSPGTARRPTTCSSGTATGRTRCSCGTSR